MIKVNYMTGRTVKHPALKESGHVVALTLYFERAFRHYFTRPHPGGKKQTVRQNKRKT